METSKDLFEKMKCYASLYNDAVDQGLVLCSKHYQKKSDECRREALVALSIEQLFKEGEDE